MKFGPVPLAQAAGKILGHNIAGAGGQRLLRKGRPLSEADLQTLADLGRASVYVAELAPDDVGENDAARRVAQALAGPGLRLPALERCRSAMWCRPYRTTCAGSATLRERAGDKSAAAAPGCVEPPLLRRP